MRVVYYALLARAAILYVAGARSIAKLNWLRALIPPGAFILWTMMQPTTAFDAFDFELSGFARTMTAVIGAVLLGTLGTLWRGRQTKRHKSED